MLVRKADSANRQAVQGSGSKTAQLHWWTVAADIGQRPQERFVPRGSKEEALADRSHLAVDQSPAVRQQCFKRPGFVARQCAN